MKIKYLIYLSILLFFTSCSNKQFNTKEEMLAFLKIEENGYFQKKSLNGVDFSLMYRPTDLLVSQELGEDTEDEQKVDELREKYNQYLYFNLSIGINGNELLSVVPKNRAEFGAMVNQLAFGMNDKVHLFNESRDTIELIDYVYPRQYGMGNATDMMFVFLRKKQAMASKGLSLTISDLGINTGEIKFKINTEIIKNEPSFNY